MATRFFVAPRSSILDKHGKLHCAHAEMKLGEHLDKKMVEEHIRSGYLVERPDANTPGDNVPGTQKNPVVPPDMDADKNQIETRHGPNDVQTSSRVKELSKGNVDNRVTVTGKWNIDPKTIQGKPLTELNAMVLERDPSIEPFKTPGEAVAQLSEDYKG